MSYNHNFPDRESTFDFNNRFQMSDNLKLCKEFYNLTKTNPHYKSIMEKLKFLSSCSEESLVKDMHTVVNDFPSLFNMIIYVIMSRASYKRFINLVHSDVLFDKDPKQTINITRYGNYAYDIQKCLKEKAAVYTCSDRPLATIYPLQNKIILFDETLIKDCIKILENKQNKSSISATYYASQVYFPRLLNRFHLQSLQQILFPECTEKRKSYHVPICSLPSLTFLFQIFHNKPDSLQMQFSILCDSFINIAVSKGLALPAILNILYILKNGYEDYKDSLPKNRTCNFFEFFKKPQKISPSADLNTQDIYYVHNLIFTKYQEMRQIYSSKIEFMEKYRKIENVILDAYTKWHKKYENTKEEKILTDIIKNSNNRYIVTTMVKGSDIIEYLNPALHVPDLEYYNLEDAISLFLSEFQYAERRYKPIPSNELFDIIENLTLFNYAMFDTLQYLIYSPDADSSNNITGLLDFFAPLPTS